MTGYGMATFENESTVVAVEVKTLNSKFLDASIKLPRVFADKEIEVRSLLSERLERGKIGVNIEYQRKDNSTPKVNIDKELFKYYYNQYKELANEVSADMSDLFRLAISAPEVINNEVVKDHEEVKQEWLNLYSVIKEAVQKCDEFRQKEGEVLMKIILGNIRNIKTYSDEISKLDPIRTEAIKNRLHQHIKDLEQVDKNRFEQEIIYYLEKLDIKEEKVRLQSHLDFFNDVVEKESSPGKKLGFISQEIGREINTIGSKANDAAIQQWVVKMKEELEQIKEQLLNII